MRACYLPVRHSCNAANAYSPSAALHLAFLSPVTRNSDFKVSIGHSRVRQKHAATRWQSITSFSTTTCAKQEALQPQISVLAEQDEDGRKIGRGGTYENYEILKNSLGVPNATERSTEPGGSDLEAKSGFRIRKHHKEVAIKQSAGGEGQIPPGRIEDVRQTPPQRRVSNLKLKQKQYSWQAHMMKIAKDAGHFSKRRIKLSDTKTIEERKRLLNYYGGYIRVEQSPMQRELRIPWALTSSQSSGKNGREVLEQEVAQFVEHMNPTPAEKVARETVISELMAFISQHTGPDVKSEVFGSERTGLALATSDVDIRLDCDIQKKNEKWQHLNTKIKDLTAAMIESQDYILVVSREGTYPILNAQHRETGIDIQIVAAPSTATQEQVTLQYMNELPHLRSLYVLLRAALGARSLVNVYNGGIGSYGLFIMLVAGIKRRSSNPPVTLTDQLFRFLDFYCGLDRITYGVSVSPPKLFRKHDAKEVPVKKFVEAARRRGDLVRSAQWAISQRRLFQPYLLCLQDPANPHNDLGRKSNAIKHINVTLNGIRTDLAADVRSATRAPGLRWTGKSILLNVVGRCHEVNYERRAKVENYGLRIMAAREEAMQGGKESHPAIREVTETVA